MQAFVFIPAESKLIKGHRSLSTSTVNTHLKDTNVRVCFESPLCASFKTLSLRGFKGPSALQAANINIRDIGPGAVPPSRSTKDGKAPPDLFELLLKVREAQAKLSPDERIARVVRVDHGIASWSGSVRVEHDMGEGKGRGLVTTRDVQPGELLLVEPALEVVDSVEAAAQLEPDQQLSGSCLPPPAVYLRLKLAARAQHDPPLVAALRELYAGPQYWGLPSDAPMDLDRISGICKHNGFGPRPLTPAWEPDVVEGSREGGSSAARPSGLWHTPAFINHACVGNASWACIGDVMVVSSVAPIPKGAEVLFCYGPGADMPYERRTQLLGNWGFACRCEVCRKQAALPDRHLQQVEGHCLALYKASRDLTYLLNEHKEGRARNVEGVTRHLVSEYRQQADRLLSAMDCGQQQWRADGHATLLQLSRSLSAALECPEAAAAAGQAAADACRLAACLALRWEPVQHGDQLPGTSPGSSSSSSEEGRDSGSSGGCSKAGSTGSTRVDVGGTSPRSGSTTMHPGSTWQPDMQYPASVSLFSSAALLTAYSLAKSLAVQAGQEGQAGQEPASAVADIDAWEARGIEVWSRQVGGDVRLWEVMHPGYRAELRAARRRAAAAAARVT